MGLDASWRRLAVESLKESPGQRLLDVGCGPGDMIRLVTTPNVMRIGLDSERAMLRMMNETVSRPGTAICGVAEALPFADGEFDAVTAAFALRNFSDRRKALSEWQRVMKPGGRGAIVEFSPPDRTLMGWIARQYVQYWLPLVGGIVSGNFNAYRYLSRTTLMFPSPAEITSEILTAGFVEVVWRRLTGQVAVLYTFRK